MSPPSNSSYWPNSAWLQNEVCRQFVLGDVPATIPVENLSAAIALVSLDGPGQKRRFNPPPATSGLLRTADIVRPAALVRLVPERNHAPQQTASLFDQLIGASKQSRRHGETERLGGLEVDGKLGLRRRLHPSGFALRKPPTTGSR
jgi:hypothetical protein